MQRQTESPYTFYTAIVHAKFQSCPTLWDPMDYTVHGILQARILERVAIFTSPGDLPNPGIKPRSPALQVDSLPAATAKPTTLHQWFLFGPYRL